MKKTIESYEVDGRGKIILKIKIYDKEYSVIKLYRDQSYEEALGEAEEAMSDLISRGLPEGTDKKVKYQIDDYEQTREETKNVYEENE